MRAQKRRRSKDNDPALAARRAAVALLSGVLDDHRLLSEMVDDELGPLHALEAQDRARAQRLATGTLRQLGAVDAMLKPLMRKRPPGQILNILRLATYELCQDKAAPHGVVNAGVSLVRETPQGKRMSGLANAVLRRVADDESERWSKLPPQRLPNWLRGRLLSAYGSGRVARIERAHASAPPTDLTAKPGNSSAVAESVGGFVLPSGSVRLTAPGQISRLPGYEEGDWWVQDAAAALPAALLDAQPRERVLDLCAAPGGKTMQLAAAGARVTALDSSGDRMGRLKDNLRRTGLSADCVVADALEWQADPFDAVLLDAPCSATGTIRRHPDLPFLRSVEDVKSLVDLQARLFDRAVALVRPGGRLVYCTCSLLTEEGEAQIDAALQRHPDLERIPVANSELDPAWINAQGDVRITPEFWADRGGLDGFFIACLTRRNNL